ncbi:MAG: response regulator transcription factor [Nitrospirae bacterium]|nr:response regulator transcription factor [Nitrospirota bacterium]
MKKPRVLMADDHSLILAGLRKLVEADCEVVGTAEDGRTLVAEAQKLRPDLILLDISMPLLNGLDAARQLRTLVPESKLIFLTMHASSTYAMEAFQVGASGYLLKRSAASELGLAIQSVLQGQCYLTPLLTKEVLDSVLKPTVREPGQSKALTPRQREVLQLVAEGRGTKEIATILSVSVKTIEFHKSRIMEQLDVHSTADLTKYAITHGITGL